LLPSSHLRVKDIRGRGGEKEKDGRKEKEISKLRVYH